MYHALALEDLLDLLNLDRARAPASVGAPRAAPACADALRRHAALAALHEPPRRRAGRLQRLRRRHRAGHTPSSSAMPQRWASQRRRRRRRRRHALQPSGYVRAGTRARRWRCWTWRRSAPTTCPATPMPTRCRFELSLAVGACCRQPRHLGLRQRRAARSCERGTAAHSTVQVGGHDSSEVWAGFRVGRRARPLDVRVRWLGGRSAAHDGYRHLPGRPLHRRRWAAGRQTRCACDDRLTRMPAAVPSRATTWRPGLRLQAAGAGRWRVHDGGDARGHASASTAARPRCEPAQHAQRFGELVPAARWRCRWPAARAVHALDLGLPDAHPLPDRQLPARGQRAGQPHARALPAVGGGRASR